ncbi:hypothetical protein EOJ32_08225 [Paracoccus sp. Arc7-R13]|uniref:hypothetical protein n=1 Tax=Paracoccus TaxID=265 RepID=UPI000FDBC006|nr:hypothetical protein [Paracoccus sp. Arc7-R13]AZY93649.1 hypothetical protein EOJ32_08225 [Paracoccus sp. Arc7-R13]
MFIELTNCDAEQPVTINVAQIVNMQPVVGTTFTSIDLAVTVGNQNAKQLIVLESYELVKRMIQKAAISFV